MSELGLEMAADLLSTVLSAIGAVVFTIVGVLVEQAGVANLTQGATGLGAWELFMGTLVLFVGIYLLGYRTAWPSIVGAR